mmetsp:Transcript_33645/g.46594  ORF Transcript_33645/g.46594 Transcript_33645/m.46594 type:complete len:171 (-) Transcript_33645:135-647(-)|eukprot:CAMPEP_0196579058 /NCGR_PEP_ID=MMETSP1081-20130531/16981_1 /TAXON_ID=36882 /ORGANISM="Pyramimonas amylifera, Strain CCMP720" /LENGTH=170 /DNA_ID=CAMNT_0041898503 /DNA_START=111 /DNA_END=623 /DNA_ORIENTATION=+
MAAFMSSRFVSKPILRNNSLSNSSSTSFALQKCGGKVSSRGALVVRAARIGGVDIPNQKRVETALTYIFGIGSTTSKAILEDTEVENKRTKDLTEDELTTLRMEVDKYQIEGDLRRFNALSIKRLKEIQCYRGRRHIAGLPMHGQKTKNNARTRKGKRIAIAGKKKAPMK